VHPKLLLADDSVTIQRVIELTFADENVQVVAVGDGQQAIDRVKSDRPDIVLADVGMPERDGYEVAAFIKGDPALAHIPVLLLTGAFEPIDEARARAVGCDGVLVKPFEPQMVISRVRDLLAGKREPAVGRQGGPGAPASTPPAGTVSEPTASLEDYFDRLDAALASKGASTPTLDPVPPATPALGVARRPTLAAAPVGADTPSSRAPHVEMDLSGWNPPAASTPHERYAPTASEPVSASSPVNPSNAVSPLNLVNPVSVVSLDQAFAALLAAEQGHPPGPASKRAEPQSREWTDVPESVIDAVVSKVLARMGDDTMRTAVLDVAERLVREEIDRIKNVR
jgi:CheY-like chemotaxis protein